MTETKEERKLKLLALKEMYEDVKLELSEIEKEIELLKEGNKENE
jgi:hypothetical protein